MTGTATRTAGPKRSARFYLILGILSLAASAQAAMGEGDPLAVVQTIPVENASEVPTTQPVVVHFSKEIDPKTLTPATFLVEGAPGTLQYDPALKSATWTPAAPLDYSKTYTATLSDEIADLDGLHLPFPYSWTFTTRTGEEKEGPLAIQQSSPAPNAAQVPVTATISITFNREVDPKTLRPDRVLLMRGERVEAAVHYDRSQRTVILTPASPLNYRDTYTVTVREGIADSAGNRLPLGTTWSFTTENPPPPIAGLAP